MRRESDMMNAPTKEALLAQQEQAHKTLSRIREQTGLKKGDKFDIDPNDIDLV